MKLVAAKCPNCGANIEVSPEMEATKCKSCGSAILVEDAIQKYKIEVSGEVSLSGISSVENDLERGNQCLSASDWETAFAMFRRAVDKKANSYDAWIGCLAALTQNFTYCDYARAKYDGNTGIESTIINILKYANQEQKQDAINRIKQVQSLIDQSVEKVVAAKIKSAKLANKVVIVMYWLFALVSFMVGVLGGGSIGFVGAIIFFMIGSIGFFAPVHYNKLKNKTLVGYAERIQHIRTIIEDAESIV